MPDSFPPDQRKNGVQVCVWCHHIVVVSVYNTLPGNYVSHINVRLTQYVNWEV